MENGPLDDNTKGRETTNNMIMMKVLENKSINITERERRITRIDRNKNGIHEIYKKGKVKTNLGHWK